MPRKRAMSVKVMLITANVGSVFEDLEKLLPVWLEEISQAVLASECNFLAIHMQEMGGKNYKNSKHLVSSFIKSITESSPLADQFDRSVSFVDDDSSREDSFTALGSVYLLHRRLTSAQIYNWKDESYCPVLGHSVHCGDLLDSATCEKRKFPLEYFPECRWSRKGFMRTRWLFGANCLDMVNIHLFHDACNITALESPMSDFCLFRQRALRYTLDFLGSVPFCLFGDFNFRVNTQAVVRRLTEGLRRSEAPESETMARSSDPEVTFSDSDDSVVLRIGKKHFQHITHQLLFLSDFDWLREYDFELEEFSSELHEFPIHFPPSYPFSEDVTRPTDLMYTRCPSWCDRVLFNRPALSLLHQNGVYNVRYQMIGKDRCTGDHKPVSLNLSVRTSRFKLASPGRAARQRLLKSQQQQLYVDRQLSPSKISTVPIKTSTGRAGRWTQVLRSRCHAVAR